LAFTSLKSVFLIKIVCADLVLITADFDPQQAEEYLARIPIKIDPSVNAESLENLPAPSLSTRRKEERESACSICYE